MLTIKNVSFNLSDNEEPLYFCLILKMEFKVYFQRGMRVVYASPLFSDRLKNIMLHLCVDVCCFELRKLLIFVT